MPAAGIQAFSRIVPMARRAGPGLLFVYGFAAAFWLWAKWLFSPQMFVLPALPPVEVLIVLVEKILGPWLVLLFTLSSFALVAFDGVRARLDGHGAWWTRSLLRGSAAAVLIHIGVWMVGTALFFAVFALMPGADLRGKSATDPAVQGLLLFTAFLSLLMSGPITGLAVAARTLARQKADGYPAAKMASLNHALAIVIVPLALLWLASGYPAASLVALRNSAAVSGQEGPAQLLAAAREGDLPRVRSLLRRGVTVETPDASGTTPLIASAANDHPEVVQALLEAGAHPNTADASGRTALMSAAANHASDVVQLLLQSGAAANQKDSSGKTALMLAAFSGHEATLLGLLAAGAEVNARSAGGETALIAAARAGKAGIVRLLLAAGADPEALDNQGNSALSWATKLSQEDVVQALVKHSAKITKR